jgi:hypothetical protein
MEDHPLANSALLKLTLALIFLSKVQEDTQILGTSDDTMTLIWNALLVRGKIGPICLSSNGLA